MLKRPVVNLNLTSCLTGDDMELLVTMLVHRFKTGAHILNDFDRSMPLRLLELDVD
jgi:hypothetical protein